VRTFFALSPKIKGSVKLNKTIIIYRTNFLNVSNYTSLILLRFFQKKIFTKIIEKKKSSVKMRVQISGKGVVSC
jgi:hypothetical protein